VREPGPRLVRSPRPGSGFAGAALADAFKSNIEGQGDDRGHTTGDCPPFTGVTATAWLTEVVLHPGSLERPHAPSSKATLPWSAESSNNCLKHTEPNRERAGVDPAS
jgi:hypothetical protein